MILTCLLLDFLNSFALSWYIRPLNLHLLRPGFADSVNSCWLQAAATHRLLHFGFLSLPSPRTEHAHTEHGSWSVDWSFCTWMDEKWQAQWEHKKLRYLSQHLLITTPTNKNTYRPSTKYKRRRRKQMHNTNALHNLQHYGFYSWVKKDFCKCCNVDCYKWK